MHPAFSVIYFTTASGAGYGILFIIGILAMAGGLPVNQTLAISSLFISLGLISAGLLSSTFHLGHPERAWRAISQWRSSWLAREGVAAILTYAPALVLAYAWIFVPDNSLMLRVSGGFAALGAIVTVFCTGSIYNSLKTIQQWANGWTMPNYLLLALATGAVILNALVAVIMGQSQSGLVLLAIFSLFLAYIFKIFYWRYIKTAHHPATLASAIGVGHMGNDVEVLEPAHTEENYLQKEMGFRVARKHAIKLKGITYLTLFILPLTLLITGQMINMQIISSLVAALSVALGVVVERWLFFAEAKHVVTLYYGAKDV
ncbi:MAG: dimethyl sulfoxide reductase anchor subunit family protein [bacterium]